MKTSGFLSANIKLTEARAKVIEDLAREFPGKSFNHIINRIARGRHWAGRERGV